MAFRGRGKQNKRGGPSNRGSNKRKRESTQDPIDRILRQEEKRQRIAESQKKFKDIYGESWIVYIIYKSF